MYIQRLPKAVAFPQDVHQVDLPKIGRSRVIVLHTTRTSAVMPAAKG